MFTRRHLTNELKNFALAPTFYVFVLGILVMMFAVFFPFVTEKAKEELEILSGDTLGFAYARVFAGRLGDLILFLPCFAVSTAAVRDKETRKRGGTVLRDGLDPVGAVLVRFFAELILLFIPLFLACFYMFSTNAGRGVPGSYTFLTTLFFFVLPALLFEVALSLAATEWTGVCVPGILLSLVVWVFSLGSTAGTGDYNSCIAVRHTELGAFNDYNSNLTTLLINRLVVTLLAAILLFAAVKGNEFRRKANRP
ncbi:MAG: hypothetical protein J6U10_05850 [Lachnospiraceae bacterium]|nr:hypothetical protein [Lachnospiraceae bacterium]